MQNTPTAEQISQLLQQEIDSARRLLDIMRREFETLSERDTDAIETTLKAKTESLARFESLEENRRGQFAQWGFPNTRNGIRDSLQSLSSAIGTQPMALWDQLTSLGEECKRQNEVNGAIVETTRRHVERALDILRGDTERDSTYGRDGNTAHGQSKQPIAKA